MIPFDSEIELQLFDSAIGKKSFLTVNSADPIEDGKFSLDFLVTYLTEPFVVVDTDPDGVPIGTRTNVVESLLAGELSAAYGLSERLQLGVALPLIFSISGDGFNVMDAGGSADGFSAIGVGDFRAELKLSLWRGNGARLAAILGATAPSSYGTENDFLGDNLPTGRFKLASQWSSESGRLEAGAEVGAIVRKPHTVLANEIGSQLTFGGAGAVHITERLSTVAELFGRTSPGLDVEATPLEVNGALRIRATDAVSVLAGGGTGLGTGIGTPALRVFVSVGWSPDLRDSDRDGIRNEEDQCPLLAEDKDGYEDSDGCPDNDNDGDKRDDSEDKCPDSAEDFDGFEDDDGCPDIDNDKDGIPDLKDSCRDEAEDGLGPFPEDGCPLSYTDADGDGVKDDVDKCPEEPEDTDEFEDWDGCPEADNDKDGIADDQDKCPLCAEDADGFEDDDGCPELDNDKDGFADSADQCPNEAEVINGSRDDDGCPDRGDPLATLNGDVMSLAESIEFRRDALRTRGRRVLNQVAVVMQRHPEIKKWLIVVAAKKERSPEATRAKGFELGDKVKAYLVSRGVGADTLEVKGALSDNAQVGFAVAERDETPIVEACPIEFQATPEAPAVNITGIEVQEGDAKPSVDITGVSVDGGGDAKPGDAKPDDAKPDGAKPDDAKPDDAKPDDAKPDGATPDDAKPADASVQSAVPDAFKPYQGVVSAIEFRRDRLRTSGRRALATIAELMKEHPNVHLEIGAHTDDSKGEDRSRVITLKQANAVVEFLVGKGVAIDRLKAVGHGMDKPLKPHGSRRNRPANRRVEFTFTVK